jgi:surfeit locus 1 family protein
MGITKKRSIPIVATVVAFVAIVIMLSLGFWQLERKVEKEQRLTQIEFASQQQSLALEEVALSYQDYQDFVIEAQGELSQSYFYIDNKLHAGRAGFNVLAPFITKSGVVILDLGWLPANAPRPSLPEFSPLILSHVKGILYIPKDNRLIKETNVSFGTFPALLQQIDLSKIEQHLGQSVLPFVLRMQPQTDAEFVREWQAVSMSPEKHLGYAIQWFGLTVAGLTVYLLSLLKWMQLPSRKESSDNPPNNS